MPSHLTNSPVAAAVVAEPAACCEVEAQANMPATADARRVPLKKRDELMMLVSLFLSTNTLPTPPAGASYGAAKHFWRRRGAGLG
jgi:hypothetical protein